MNWRALAVFTVAIITGALLSAYLPESHGVQTELAHVDKITISKGGSISSGAPSAPGFLFRGGLLAHAEDVDFAEPVNHDVKLDIPPVHKCNPFDHVRLYSNPVSPSRKPQKSKSLLFSEMGSWVVNLSIYFAGPQLGFFGFAA